jgi:uncharacterized protein YciI
VEEFAYLIEPARPGMLADPTEEERAAVRAHYEYLVRLLEAGRLIVAGRTLAPDQSLGVVAFEADDQVGARQVMDRDPAVARGVFRATFHRFRVALLRGRPA